MISELFVTQLFLTFLVGSTWIYLTVYSGIWFGSRISGFIGGLPSTALLSFFFIGLTQSTEIAAKATTVFPLAIAISGLFLVVYASLVNKGHWGALIIGLVVWFLLSAAVKIIHPGSFMVNLLIYIVIMLLSYLIMDKMLMIKIIPFKNIPVRGKHLLFRSLFGGFIIMLAVFITKIGGPVLGGIFAAFPAMFIATLSVNYSLHGASFSKAMTKPLLVTGMITVAVYAISLRYLYPLSGLYWGTVFCIIIAALSAYLTFEHVLPRIR